MLKIILLVVSGAWAGWCDVVCSSVSPVSSQDIIPPDQPCSGWGSKVGKDGEIRERKGLEEHRRLERPRFDINSCCLSGIKEIEVAG